MSNISVYRVNDTNIPTEVMGDGSNILKDPVSDNLRQSKMRPDLHLSKGCSNPELFQEEDSVKTNTKLKMDLLTIPSTPTDDLQMPPSFKSTRMSSTVEFK